MAFALPELAALAALAACAFLVMLYYAYGYSVGAVLQLLASGFRNLSVNVWFLGRIGFGFVADMIDGLDNDIRHAIGTGISYTERGWHYMLHYSAYALIRTGQIIEGLGQDTYKALETVVSVTVPRFVTARLASLVRDVAALQALVATLPRRAEILVERPITVVKQAITRVERAAIAIPLPRIGTLERDYAGLRARLRQLEKAVSLGSIAAIVAAGLAALGLGHLSCSNTKRFNKALCGAPTSWLENLLLGTLAIFGTLSLVELAKAMQGLTGELEGEISHFWRASAAPGAARNPGLGETGL